MTAGLVVLLVRPTLSEIRLGSARAVVLSGINCHESRPVLIQDEGCPANDRWISAPREIDLVDID